MFLKNFNQGAVWSLNDSQWDGRPNVTNKHIEDGQGVCLYTLDAATISSTKLLSKLPPI
jgi:hypothetical protein